MSDTSIKLGKRIRSLRTELGISQEELAFRALISSAHLGQIERALKVPTIDTVQKISNALNVPLYELFNSETEAVSSKSTIGNVTLNKINSYLSSMSDEELNDVLKMIKLLRHFKSI